MTKKQDIVAILGEVRETSNIHAREPKRTASETSTADQRNMSAHDDGDVKTLTATATQQEVPVKY